VRLDLTDLTLSLTASAISVHRETFKIIQDHWNDGTCLWVFDLEHRICEAKLEPVIAIKLRDQVTVLIDKRELLGITREHHLVDVDFEQLLFLGLTLGVEEDVVYRALVAADDGFGAVFIHERRLVVHHDLFLEL